MKWLKYKFTQKLTKELNKEQLKRQIFQTTLKLAEIFIEYEFYYDSILNYKLRMYSKSWLFSKISGIYKYLVCCFDSKKLAKSDFKNLLLCYYYHSKAKSIAPQILQIEKKDTIKKYK